MARAVTFVLSCLTVLVLAVPVSGQVLTVQGDAAGTPIPVSGDILASIAASSSQTVDALNNLSDPAVAGNAITSAPDGIPSMCRAVDIDGSTLPGAVSEDQYQHCFTSLNGPLLVVLTNELGTVDVAQRLADGLGQEDEAETPGGRLFAAGSVRRDAMASSAGATGDNATLNTDANGLLWTRTADPCTGLNVVTVPVSTTADVALVTATSGKRNTICGGTLVAGAAEIVNLWEGTGSACDTSSAAVAGSTTEANGMSFAANGGFIVVGRMRGLSANVDTCLRISGSNRVAGYITYVQE